MTDESNFPKKVGYRNPPKHGQIRKGEVRNPEGRNGRNGGQLAIDLGAGLDEAAHIDANGRQRSYREIYWLQQVSYAAKGRFPAIKRLLLAFLKYGVLQHNSSKSGVVTIPKEIDWELGRALLAKHGPPPWTAKQISLEKRVRDKAAKRRARREAEQRSQRRTALIEKHRDDFARRRAARTSK